MEREIRIILSLLAIFFGATTILLELIIVCLRGSFTGLTIFNTIGAILFLIIGGFSLKL